MDVSDLEESEPFPPAPPESFDAAPIDPVTSPLSGAQFGDLVRSAAVDTGPSSSDMKQLWESGLMKLIFGKDDFIPSLPEVQAHPMPVQEPVTSTSLSPSCVEPSVSGPKADSVFLKCIRKIADVDYWTKQRIHEESCNQ